MTVLTKPISIKKSDKLDIPLVQNEVTAEAALTKDDVEIDLRPRFQDFVRERARRVSTTTTICACVTAILVITAGVIGGIYLYRQLAREQMHHFRAWCDIPFKDLDAYSSYQSKQTAYGSDYLNSELDSSSLEDKDIPLSSFKEEIDMDLDSDMYEKITVPDFTGGRRGRFIHDFSANKTGIIDLEGRRCFVMPLNRTLVLPPHSLLDLVLKMRAGYYEVDTEVVRDTMSVVYPPITDFSSVGYYIARECATLNTYMLEKVTPVMRQDSHSFQKRSAEEEGSLYTHFSGSKIWSIRIVDKNSADYAV